MTAKVAKLVAKNGGKSPVPDAPEWLGAEARAEWARVAPVLHARGALTCATFGALETYVSSVATVRQCESAIAREGVTITGPGGVPRAHPCLGMKNKAAAVVLQLAKRLGLLEDAAAAKGRTSQSENDPYRDLGIL